jgi:putative phosphoribosyl transferase
VQTELVSIASGSARIEGMLELPDNPTGIVLFAHGSGSSRLSLRNNFVAGLLRDAGLGTLLMDLLTPNEDLSRESRFDIALLSQRLHAALAWARERPETRNLPVGLFGASTGAAAALQVAAAAASSVAAVVSRGGRPDLAGRAALEKVAAPTLLVVGGLDDPVVELNRAALALLSCEKQLTIVPGATHLFEEPGKLQSVAELAREWFVQHLGESLS